MLDVDWLDRLIDVYHGFSIQFHINLNIADCGSLLVDVALDLVMPGVKLEEVYRTCLLWLPFQKLSHELNLFILARELDLVTFEYGSFLLYLYHQLLHAVFKNTCYLCLYSFCIRFNCSQLLLDEINLIMYKCFLIFQSHIIILGFVQSIIVGDFYVD